MTQYDVVILTDNRYVNPLSQEEYVQNILKEDGLVKEGLERSGLIVGRKSWDDPNFDWSQTKAVLFRSTWDYFDRIEEFFTWLEMVKEKTKLINSYQLIKWNLDKSYLRDLALKGVRIPPTTFISKGDSRNLSDICQTTNWEHFILKPAIAGAARHTYKFDYGSIESVVPIFNELIQQEDFLLQQFQESVLENGEASLIIIGGKFTHAVLKRAKPGDFRVQDDFGGTLHHYTPTQSEIKLSEDAIANCPDVPLYARADIIWLDNGNPCISELELIEPELWFRRNPDAAHQLAEVIRFVS